MHPFARGAALGGGLWLAACAAEPAGGVAEGEGAQRAGDAKLAACASPLMRQVFDETAHVVSRGAVPAALYATSKNAAHDTPLVTGPEIFPAMGRLIEGARHEVVLQTFVWTDSDPAREILASVKRLEARRKIEAPGGAPVVVRILVDVTTTIGQMKILPGIARSLEALALDPAVVKWEVSGYPHVALGNLHSKVLVVDGRSAIVTGANVQPAHDYAEPWHDTAYALEGEVAEALLADFDASYERGVVWACDSRGRPDDAACKARPRKIDHPVDRAWIDARHRAACLPMLVVTRNADGNPASNDVDNPQDQAFLSAVRHAQRVVRIHTPNLNDDAIKGAIVDAIARNPALVVEIVVSKGFNENSEQLPGQGGTNAKNVAELYARVASRVGVVQVCERLRVRWYSHAGGSPVIGNGPYASHAKYMSIDDGLVIVGSANMDTQAWNNSHETNVVVDDAATARAWDAKMFAPSFARGVVVDECRGLPQSVATRIPRFAQAVTVLP
jgi:phosphatidylserine/phosphatidylglycerophosphate/cardiolipin synthase-like enzyme